MTFIPINCIAGAGRRAWDFYGPLRVDEVAPADLPVRADGGGDRPRESTDFAPGAFPSEISPDPLSALGLRGGWRHLAEDGRPGRFGL